MSNFTIEITAPSIVAVLEKLISAITPKAFTPVPAPLPQTPAEQAIRQQVISAQQPTPTYTPSAAPLSQPQYSAPPQQYLAPVQQSYQPAAPINPTSAAPIQTPAAPCMSNANVAPQQTAPLNTQAPVAAAPTYSMDDLARAASQLMDAGKQQELLGLLTKFNVQALTQLPPAQYGAFATELRQMGAKV